MNIDKYIENHITPQSPLLRKIERATHQHTTQPRMMSGHLQGELLRMISTMIAPKNILELGTFTGYSAVCLAQGMDKNEGTLHTIDINDELESMTSAFFEESGLNIIQHIGDARDIIPTLNTQFDLVFMDANKRQYPEYYEILMSGNYLHSGSVILADNTLWDGKVAQEPTPTDAQTTALIEFNRTVAEDPRVDKVIIPLRDGLSMIRIL